MAMHGWTVAALALTAALATGAIAWPASLKTGVGAAVAAHLTVPATVDKQLRSLFTEATDLPETPRMLGKSDAGVFYRDANETVVPPFGRELCIAHIHTADPYDGAGRAAKYKTLATLSKKYAPRSTAMLHSMLYAARHGYSYRYVISPWDFKLRDRYVTWAKIPQMYALLKEFRYVVVLDPDAYFAKPAIPLHLLLGHWGWKPHSSLLFAEDPPWEQNWDSHKRTSLNFGFIVAQSTQKTLQTLKDLWDAPDSIEGADFWKLNWTHEQRTFSNYLRDGLVEGEELIIASCADANDSGVQYCNGTFVSHMWGRKDEVNDWMLGSILQDFLTVLEDHADASGVIVQAPNDGVADITAT